MKKEGIPRLDKVDRHIQNLAIFTGFWHGKYFLLGVHNQIKKRTIPSNTLEISHSVMKLFMEIFTNTKRSRKHRTDEWRKARLGQQIGEDVCRLLPYKATALAHKWPDCHVGYVRYDSGCTAETKNNGPFRDGAMEKTIIYEGHIYKAKL